MWTPGTQQLVDTWHSTCKHLALNNMWTPGTQQHVDTWHTTTCGHLALNNMWTPGTQQHVDTWQPMETDPGMLRRIDARARRFSMRFCRLSNSAFIRSSTAPTSVCPCKCSRATNIRLGQPIALAELQVALVHAEHQKMSTIP